jgi:hypothetical protein
MEKHLAEADSSDVDGPPRRFHVELFIVHPTMDPATISAALGLEAHKASRVGDPRTNRHGTALGGTYPDTRWRHSVEHRLAHQWYANEVAEFVDRLMVHQPFLRDIRSTGGDTSVIIQFLDGYFGDTLTSAMLKQLAELQVDLGIECYTSMTDS